MYLKSTVDLEFFRNFDGNWAKHTFDAGKSQVDIFLTSIGNKEVIQNGISDLPHPCHFKLSDDSTDVGKDNFLHVR